MKDTKAIKKTKTIKKPVKHIADPFWKWFEVQDYLETKHKIDLRNLNTKKSERHDFWSWMADRYEIRNDNYFWLDISDLLEEEVDDEECGTPDWVKETLQLLYDEFGEHEMNFWVSW